MRYLAIDLGGKRTGLAVGDAPTRIVTPLEVIVTADAGERLRRIRRVIERYAPDALVVGLPLNMDGTAGSGAAAVRAFAEQLRIACGLPVHLVDERLSSFAADQQMSQSGLTRGQKKQRRDALAAAAILGDFLGRPTPPPGGPADAGQADPSS